MGSLKKIPKKTTDIAYRIIDGEAVIISLQQLGTGEIIKVLNVTGTKIWELIDGKKSVSDIVKRLTRAYDGLSKTLEADIIAFLNELHTNKFIYF